MCVRVCVCSYVDNGRDPDAFTERSLRACAAERAALNGKLMALGEFRAQLVRQLESTFGAAGDATAAAAGATAGATAATAATGVDGVAAKPQR